MRVQDAVEQICLREPFFTNLVKQLRIVEDNQCPTMGTDGESLFYNKDFVDKLTEGELSGVMLHETLHCVFRHMLRREKRDPFIFNVAADYAINGIVLENFPLPEGHLYEKKYDGMSTEAIYDDLIKNAKKQKGSGNGGDGQPQQQKWGDHSKWEQGGDQKQKGQSVGDQIKKGIKKMFGEAEEERRNEQERRERIARKWQKAFEDMTRQYGKAPESIKRHIESGFYKPQIDWTSLISQLLTEDYNDYSFSVRDRRFTDSDVFMPAQSSIDKLQDVVFAFDTSGSINDEQLRAFYMETISLFNNFISLQGWVGVCDSELHAFNQIFNQSAFEDFNFSGGGGTSFRPIFNEIEKRSINPKALFYFTDTEGDFPSVEPNYPVFWLVRGGRGTVPFGTIINF